VQLSALEIRVARSENLPVLPQIVGKALRLADDPNVSARDLEHLIEREPAIAGKVMRVANSAAYGRACAPTLNRAISLLGFNLMRALIIGVAFQESLATRESAKNLDRVALWRHSLATATAARILGCLRMPRIAEELFVAGMLHDVGLLVLDRFAPAELDAAICLARAERSPLYHAEQQRNGWDHTDAGGILADKWGLPALIKHAILFHHNPLMDGEYYETTCYIAAANALAHQCGYRNNQPEAVFAIDEEVAAAISMPVEQFASISLVVINEVAKAEQAFGIGHGEVAA
jgi:HD-like signal output (HDOD) protein